MSVAEELGRVAGLLEGLGPMLEDTTRRVNALESRCTAVERDMVNQGDGHAEAHRQYNRRLEGGDTEFKTLATRVLTIELAVHAIQGSSNKWSGRLWTVAGWFGSAAAAAFVTWFLTRKP